MQPARSGPGPGECRRATGPTARCEAATRRAGAPRAAGAPPPPPAPRPGRKHPPPERFAPGSLLRAGLLVAPLMAVGNGINYVYNVVMARLLGPAGYRAPGPALAVAPIVSVR